LLPSSLLSHFTKLASFSTDLAKDFTWVSTAHAETFLTTFLAGFFAGIGKLH